MINHTVDNFIWKGKLPLWSKRCSEPPQGCGWHCHLAFCLGIIIGGLRRQKRGQAHLADSEILTGLSILTRTILSGYLTKAFFPLKLSNSQWALFPEWAKTKITIVSCGKLQRWKHWVLFIWSKEDKDIYKNNKVY